MDTSKHVFQLHGVNAAEVALLREKLRRKEAAVPNDGSHRRLRSRSPLAEAKQDVQRLKPEWRALLPDLDRLQEIEVAQDGKHFTLRTSVTGAAGQVFQAIGTALPPNIRNAAPPSDV